MLENEHRRHRRTAIRLPVVVTRLAQDAKATRPAWTRDISAGGMYCFVRASELPGEGTVLAFDLDVPPGEGYSVQGGRIRGAGKVLRPAAVNGQTIGLAVEFTEALRLEF